MAWYETWFKQEYLSLYSHRDREEACQQVSFLCEQLSTLLTLPSAEVIDVACGTGRHALEFARRGWTVDGIDLSEDLLRHAREVLLSIPADVQARLTFSRGDMRKLPFADGSFALLTNFFTGFGYFESDAEHQYLINEWARVVRRGGAVFLDYLNRDYVIEHLEEKTETDNAEYQFLQERSIVDEGKRVRKKIKIRDKASGESREFEESVRMYSLAELTIFCENAGLEILRTWGDFQGTEFSSVTPRLMMLARK